KSLVYLRLGQADPEALAGLKDAAGLETLDLNYSIMNDKAAPHLANLKSLKRLDASHSQYFTDEGIKHLQGLTNLEFLNLSSTRLSDDGMQYLAGMTKLKPLYLSENRLKGPGLKYLSNLNALEELSLSGTSVGDAHLPLLRGLKKLRELN